MLSFNCCYGPCIADETKEYYNEIKANMKKRLSCNIENDISQKFDQKARNFGLSRAAFLRRIVISNLKQEDTPLNQKVILKAIKSLVPVLARAFGIVYKVSSENEKGLERQLTKIWELYNSSASQVLQDNRD